MNEIQLPSTSINFGKYKGKCISELLSDIEYVKWLKQQSWLEERNKTIYNIIIKNDLSPNTNSKTPEHNKLQNLFLNKDNQQKLVNYYKLDNNTILKIIFEDKFNWDFCLYIADLKSCNDINVFCCELKPTLSDDYPCVLRKMKNQIEQMKKGSNMFMHCTELFENNHHLRYCSDKTKYILLIESFTSKYTSKKGLITIFKQSNIDVIFINELFNNLNVMEKLTYNELLE
jgi:uncharacterized protein (DUF3820 family)